MLVVVGASNNTLGVSPFLFYFLDGSKKHINLIDDGFVKSPIKANFQILHLIISEGYEIEI